MWHAPSDSQIEFMRVCVREYVRVCVLVCVVIIVVTWWVRVCRERRCHRCASLAFPHRISQFLAQKSKTFSPCQSKLIANRRYMWVSIHWYTYFVEFTPYLHIFFMCHFFSSFILKLVDSIYHPFKFICDTKIKNNKMSEVEKEKMGRWKVVEVEKHFLARLLWYCMPSYL